MSDVECFGWPRHEPVWLDFEMGAGMIAGKDFLLQWHGADSPEYAETMDVATSEWWSVLSERNRTAWVIGDVPGILAPSVGVRNELPALCLWKWLGAPEGFVMPLEYDLGSLGKSRSEWIGTVSTSDEELYLFGSHERGDDVLRDPGRPTLRFERGTCNVEVRTFVIGEESDKAEFQAYIFWGSFAELRWEFPPETSEVPNHLP